MFSCFVDKFFAFVDAIEEKYHDVPYHNRFHATDVVANMYFWSRSPTFRRFISSDLDLMIALVAAAVHDVGHPGTSNDFQVNTRSKWAVLYNDQVCTDICCLSMLVLGFLLIVVNIKRLYCLSFAIISP